MLTQALRKTRDFQWRLESRDKVASVAYFPIVQLAFDYVHKEYTLAWSDSEKAKELLPEAERKAVAKEYEVLLGRGPRRG